MPLLRRIASWLSVVTTITAVALIGTVAPASADITNVTVVNAVDGLCLAESNSPNTALIQGYCGYAPTQTWTFITITAGVYEIKNATGRCINAVGGSVQDWTCGGVAAEWSIVGPSIDISLRSVNTNSCLSRADSVGNSQLIMSLCPLPTRSGQWVNPALV